MIKISHFTYLRTSVSGIQAQLKYEAIATRTLCYWYTRCFIPLQSRQSKDLVCAFFREYTNILSTEFSYYFSISKSLHDRHIVLLRYRPLCFVQILFLCYARLAYSSPVLLVLHADSSAEVLLQYSKPLSLLLYSCEQLLMHLSLRLTKGIVCATLELSRRYKIFKHQETYIYPNGILPKNAYHHYVHQSKTPDIVFTASSFEPWQGLDLLLAELKIVDIPLRLHLIGNIPSKYDKEFIKGDPRIIHHGHLPPDQIASVYAQCTIGIASLALHRQGLSEACSLKVRDYLCAGLAVFGNYNETGLENCPHYIYSPLDIRLLHSYATKYLRISKGQVLSDSLPLIDKAQLCSSLHRELSATTYQ